jgi:hypothetical protein
LSNCSKTLNIALSFKDFHVCCVHIPSHALFGDAYFELEYWKLWAYSSWYMYILNIYRYPFFM